MKYLKKLSSFKSMDFVSHMTYSIAFGCIFSLIFEIPFLKLDRLLFRNNEKKEKHKKLEENQNPQEENQEEENVENVSIKLSQETLEADKHIHNLNMEEIIRIRPISYLNGGYRDDRV